MTAIRLRPAADDDLGFLDGLHDDDAYAFFAVNHRPTTFEIELWIREGGSPAVDFQIVCSAETGAPIGWIRADIDFDDGLTFVLDLVLTPTHPEYSPPPCDQARCFRRGTLVVESDAAIFLHRSSLPPAVDASGELDYGQIDTFCPVSGLGAGMWELTGSWGEAIARQPRVRVDLHGATER
jgi:hypothetical protein